MVVLVLVVEVVVGGSGAEGKLRNVPYRPSPLGPPIIIIIIMWRRAARALCQGFDI